MERLFFRIFQVLVETMDKNMKHIWKPGASILRLMFDLWFLQTSSSWWLNQRNWKTILVKTDHFPCMYIYIYHPIIPILISSITSMFPLQLQLENEKSCASVSGLTASPAKVWESISMIDGSSKMLMVQDLKNDSTSPSTGSPSRLYCYILPGGKEVVRWIINKKTSGCFRK